MNKFRLFILVAAGFAMVACSACQSTTDSAGKTTSSLSPQAKEVLAKAGQVLGPAIVDELVIVGTQALSGQKITAQSAASTAANALWANVGNVGSGQDVQQLLLQHGKAAIPGVVSAAASAFSNSSNPDAGAKANAIAAVISTLAGAPPAPSTVK